METQTAALSEPSPLPLIPSPAPAPPPPKPEPFSFGDFSWVNGTNRQPAALFDSKYVTGSVLLDANYVYSFNNPIDHTIVGTTVTPRHNELNLVMASVGADFHHENVRASLSLQYGARPNLIQKNDATALRGQYELADTLKYIREANFGYHFDVLYGLNIDLGIFMSYVGLFSYLSFENWSYQPSYTTESVPWYFEGARIQIFPTERIKIELWLVNGWQAYAKFNEAPGAGLSFLWRPREWISLITNDYFGVETRGDPGRVRFHTDNSALLRYFNRPDGRFVSRAALSLTLDYGFEQGGSLNVGVSEQSFFSIMVYNRIWFDRGLFGLTLGGGYVNNPGRYLVLLPPEPPSLSAVNHFQVAPGLPFFTFDFSATLDWMPNSYMTYRLEYVYRFASVPYYNGPGGITAPDGYIDSAVASFLPDRVTEESRIILAFLLRL